jgi:excisionase family DNA binding protein
VTGREVLELTFSPAVLEAIEELVEERVQERLQLFTGVSSSSPWLSVDEAAEYLGVSSRSIERMIAKKRLRSHPVGRRRLLHRDELDKAATGEDVAPTTPARRQV